MPTPCLRGPIREPARPDHRWVRRREEVVCAERHGWPVPSVAPWTMWAGTYCGPIGHLVGHPTEMPVRSSWDAAGIELRKCSCSLDRRHHQMVQALSTIRAGQQAYTNGS